MIYIIPIILLSMIPGYSIRSTKFIISEWIIIALITWRFKNKWVKTFILLLLARSITLFGSPQYTQASEQIIAVFLYALFFDMLCRKISDFEKILDMLCIVGVVQATLMILQASGIWIFFHDKNLPLISGFSFIGISAPQLIPIGFTDNPNMANALLALCFPAFLRKEWYPAIILILSAMFLNFEHGLGGIIPVLMVILILLWKRWFWSVFIVAGLIGYLLSIGWHTGREWVFMESVKNILPKYWLFGSGLGQFGVLFSSVKSNIVFMWNEAHNEYLQIWIEGGIFALLIIVGLIISTLKKLWVIREHRLTGVVFFGLLIGLINSSVNFLFHAPYCIVVLIYLAMTEVYYEEKEKRHNLS